MQIPIPKLTILDAINFTANAWNSVQPSTIASCWSRTEILPPSRTMGIDGYINWPSDDENEIVQQLIEKLVPEDNLTAKEYITVDSALKTEDMLDDDDIVALIRGDEEVEEDNACQTVESVVTVGEAVDSIDRLETFLTNAEGEFDVSNAFMIELKRLRKKFCQSIVDSKVQMDITSFLSTE